MCVFVRCCLATKTLYLITRSRMGGGDYGCGSGLLGVTSISYIHQTEQHSPFGLMLLRLGNVTIMCVCVCVCVCVCRAESGNGER